MASSGSFARGDRPRSVPDPLAGPYDRMAAQQRAYNARQEAEHERGLTETASESIRPTLPGPQTSHRQINHPGTWESMVPIWGSGKEALADLEDKNYVGAAINAGLALSDIALAKAIVSGLAKGGLKTAAPYVWKTKPGQVQGARQWLGQKGFVGRGQPAHHWLFEQKSSVPDWIKNQPPFITPMKDAVEHGRIHGPYTVDGVKLPQFGAGERLWRGTPPWAKAAYVSSAGHGGEAVGRAGADPASLNEPRR